MSRRLNHKPIKLIQLLPLPEQISTAQPLKRWLSWALVETGGVCRRAITKVIAHFKRLGRIVRTAVGGETGSSASSLTRAKEWIGTCIRTFTSRWSRSPDQLVERIVNLTETEQPIYPVSSRPTEMLSEALPVSAALDWSIQHEEVVEQETHILRQQEDISRLSTQIQELKSLVVSQQQVLVYLGKELELTQTQLSTMTAAASVSAKQNRIVRDKSIVKRKRDSTQGSPDAVARPVRRQVTGPGFERVRSISPPQAGPDPMC